MGLQMVLYLLATLLRAAESRLSQCSMTMRSSSVGRPANDIVGLTPSILSLLVKNSFFLPEMSCRGNSECGWWICYNFIHKDVQRQRA